MDNQKQELIKKLKDANNILVTVSANPSVDQLAACIGITLFLNKLKKHATAVFSGEVPSTLQFLKPEDTLEKNTDSLRDFIVSLDKSKADKLRYKVEDNIVKIFITPYKTSITEADLDFSQGDFNVDVVLCLGVEKQQDLDQAITSHGRILHDATVASVSIGAAGELGTLNWVEPQASSLSELAAQIADALDKEQLDGQIATSFLTGIVAETDRFSNEKTSPTTMQLSAELMGAGANQQLVASELQSDGLALNAPKSASDTASDTTGTLEIGHGGEDASNQTPVQADDTKLADPADGDQSGISPLLEGDGMTPGPASRLILQPPSMGGTLTANSAPEGFDPSVDPLTMLNSDAPMLKHDPDEPATDAPPVVNQGDQPNSMSLPTVQPLADTELDEPVVDLPTSEQQVTLPAADKLPGFEPLSSEPLAPPAPELPTPPLEVLQASEPAPEQSLSDLEKSVASPHVAAPAADEALEAARAAVTDARDNGSDTGPPPPLQAAGAEGYLNVQDLPDEANASTPTGLAPNQDMAPLSASPADAPQTMPTPPSLSIPPVDPTPPTSVANDPTAPPPVPPPLPIDDLSKFTEPK